MAALEGLVATLEVCVNLVPLCRIILITFSYLTSCRLTHKAGIKLLAMSSISLLFLPTALYTLPAMNHLLWIKLTGKRCLLK
jgi:N6-adenosine-specific RNA methylase IME4